jgi:hypothetical protein
MEMKFYTSFHKTNTIVLSLLSTTCRDDNNTYAQFT